MYFTRLGKDKGISASLTKSNNKFYPFTVSTELESEKTYSPCDLLVIYKFNGDKSAAFKWMVDNGFGQIKKRVERQIIKSSVHSRSTIPANFSEEAKTEFEKLKSEIQENMPYGIFWEQDPEKPNKFSVSREDLYRAFHNLGLKYLYQLEKTLEKDNKTEDEVKLSNILTRAKAKCYAQKFEGAAVGAFNANIIARDLGLADKKEIESSGNIVLQMPSEADGLGE